MYGSELPLRSVLKAFLWSLLLCAANCDGIVRRRSGHPAQRVPAAVAGRLFGRAGDAGIGTRSPRDRAGALGATHRELDMPDSSSDRSSGEGARMRQGSAAASRYLGSAMDGAGVSLSREEEVALLLRVQRAQQISDAKAALEEKVKRKVTLDEWVSVVQLSSAEELLRLEQEGLWAREQLCVANIRLVSSECARLAYTQRVSVPFNDLFQEGLIGLTKAMEKYDISRAADVKFSSYALFWIKEALQRACSRQSRMIHVPVSQQRKWRGVLKAMAELEEALGRSPSLAEVASAVKMGPKELLALEENIKRRVGSLDERNSVQKQTGGSGEGAGVDLQDELHASDDGGVLYSSGGGAEESVSPERSVETAQWMELLQKLLKPEEVDVVLLKFGFLDSAPLSNAAVARLVGAQQDTVRNRLNRALKKLRSEVEKEGVDEDALNEAVRMISLKSTRGHPAF